MNKQNTSSVFNLIEARKALRTGAPMIVSGVDIVSCQILGRDFQFATNRPKDPIQRKHRKGRFYEPKELVEIKSHFPFGGTFVDIGANVGNHSIFVAAFMAPSRVIPFEPNPEAYQLLMANVAMNGLKEVFDLRHLGVGLSDSNADGFNMVFQPRNLGGSRMIEDGGELKVVVGDEALEDISPDMIKVDVEGMEMKVLRGLERTIARSRPVIMIEVDDANSVDFLVWIKDQNYTISQSVRRYRNNTNYILKSCDQVVAAPGDEDADSLDGTGT